MMIIAAITPDIAHKQQVPTVVSFFPVELSAAPIQIANRKSQSEMRQWSQKNLHSAMQAKIYFHLSITNARGVMV